MSLKKCPKSQKFKSQTHNNFQIFSMVFWRENLRMLQYVVIYIKKSNHCCLIEFWFLTIFGVILIINSIKNRNLAFHWLRGASRPKNGWAFLLCIAMNTLRARFRKAWSFPNTPRIIYINGFWTQTLWVWWAVTVTRVNYLTWSMVDVDRSMVRGENCIISLYLTSRHA